MDVGSVLRKKLAILLLTGSLLGMTGCKASTAALPQPPLCRVVTRVEVDYENGPLHAQRCYTSSEKMEQVLNYLRQIDPYGTPQESPETISGSDYVIILSYSDGFQKRYHQKGDRYFQTENGRWARIDPDRAEKLAQLLGAMPSDGERA